PRSPQLVGEPEGVVLGFHVDPGPRIPIGEPYTTEVGLPLEPLDTEHDFVAYLIHGIQAREAGADHGDIDIKPTETHPTLPPRPSAEQQHYRIPRLHLCRRDDGNKSHQPPLWQRRIWYRTFAARIPARRNIDIKQPGERAFCALVWERGPHRYFSSL